jgi:hypothetical protein
VAFGIFDAYHGDDRFEALDFPQVRGDKRIELPSHDGRRLTTQKDRPSPDRDKSD